MVWMPKQINWPLVKENGLHLNCICQLESETLAELQLSQGCTFEIFIGSGFYWIRKWRNCFFPGWWLWLRRCGAENPKRIAWLHSNHFLSLTLSLSHTHTRTPSLSLSLSLSSCFHLADLSGLFAHTHTLRRTHTHTLSHSLTLSIATLPVFNVDFFFNREPNFLIDPPSLVCKS